MMHLLFILLIVALFLWDTSKKPKSTGKKTVAKPLRPAAGMPAFPAEPSRMPEPVNIPEMSIPRMPMQPQFVLQDTSKPQPRQPKAKPSSKKTKPAAVEAHTPKAAPTPVRFRTVDDARRAFIYSEIFNRKY